MPGPPTDVASTCHKFAVGTERAENPIQRRTITSPDHSMGSHKLASELNCVQLSMLRDTLRDRRFWFLIAYRL